MADDELLRSRPIYAANPKSAEVTAFQGFDAFGRLWRGGANSKLYICVIGLAGMGGVDAKTFRDLGENLVSKAISDYNRNVCVALRECKRAR